MDSKSSFVQCGDFLFKRRNAVFPFILIGLLVAFPPPASYFGSYEIANIKNILAIGLLLAGLLFRATTIGFAYIKRGGLNKEVYADTLVTEGFFTLCRNPLYVGNMAIYSGIFIFHGHPVVMIFGIALYYTIYEMIIAAEEFFLRNKFGVAYEDYCRKVSRWWPDFSRFRQATEGMSFSIGRVIAKDYTTIFNAVTGVVMIACLKSFYNEPHENFLRTCQVSGLLILTLLAGVMVIKSMKKAGKFS